ncbi:MAG: hypothetical protein GWN99_12635 [Gemmatimonadetes bacterium]|uniref:STAS domain-containing protein n=1 Tax=Candidatus Kutchimonas denitrificans TaxID=3056748 RepID=A0AAE4Z8F1_9BACT|nr:hypothetical protein [Gemmatimonadota bacterium]NIR75578.1 hypothetical protein [Candidatus Kutchimonas denitrificans]NIS01892.1 hypothetical protein [Gemmatimonadota bacterium]NIT67673.1 hypothetical protein [Gemmatimonadota bacterium]NIU53547.1 hypothetical protein [Gemmatimonadota bacterium]
MHSGLGGGVRTVLRTSVATLYSNLVTRPTGEAVRTAIERQIEESRAPCLSILDFTHVGVLDLSCADEVIAKLLLKYRRPDRPAEVFFVVQGASEHHRDQIESVLERRNLVLVALDRRGPALLGRTPSRLKEAWQHLDRLGATAVGQFASERGVAEPVANSWLRRLAEWRLAVPDGRTRYASLGSAIGSGYPVGPGELPGLAADGGVAGYEEGGAVL